VGRQDAAAWEEGLPAHERLNALHLLAVTGKQAVDLAVLVCGQELQIHRVARDEPAIARLVLLESRFWRCVELNQSPLSSSDQRSIRSAAEGGEVACGSP
jgi:predicted phage-related endonuclease